MSFSCLLFFCYNYMYYLVILNSKDINFANRPITFVCIVNSGYGVLWIINDSVYSEIIKMYDDYSI